ncbi:MAG: helix-turn-helix domain-containing protein [Promethearchaeia archaeon]
MQTDSGKEEGVRGIIDLDNLLELLGNPTRRIILSKIAKVPHSTSELAHELDISRQAVHSQLEILKESDLIEKVKPKKKRGGRYKIKSNISVTIDITPDYFSIDYKAAGEEDIEKFTKLKDITCKEEYEKSKTPNQKMKFLGEQIKKIEDTVQNLEKKRKELLLQKECFIKELKTLLNERYKQQLMKNIEQRQSKKKFITESLNLGQEIFISIFSNTERYHRFKIDHLLDELFNNMDIVKREQKRVSTEILLSDLSGILDILREDEDFWFIDL